MTRLRRRSFIIGIALLVVSFLVLITENENSSPLRDEHSATAKLATVATPSDPRREPTTQQRSKTVTVLWPRGPSDTTCWCAVSRTGRVVRGRGIQIPIVREEAPYLLRINREKAPARWVWFVKDSPDALAQPMPCQLEVTFVSEDQVEEEVEEEAKVLFVIWGEAPLPLDDRVGLEPFLGNGLPDDDVMKLAYRKARALFPDLHAEFGIERWVVSSERRFVVPQGAPMRLAHPGRPVTKALLDDRNLAIEEGGVVTGRVPQVSASVLRLSLGKEATLTGILDPMVRGRGATGVVWLYDRRQDEQRTERRLEFRVGANPKNGRFQLKRVPAGPKSLIFSVRDSDGGHHFGGHEFVMPAHDEDLGTLLSQGSTIFAEPRFVDEEGQVLHASEVLIEPSSFRLPTLFYRRDYTLGPTLAAEMTLGAVRTELSGLLDGDYRIEATGLRKSPAIKPMLQVDFEAAVATFTIPSTDSLVSLTIPVRRYRIREFVVEATAAASRDGVLLVYGADDRLIEHQRLRGATGRIRGRLALGLRAQRIVYCAVLGPRALVIDQRDLAGSRELHLAPKAAAVRRLQLCDDQGDSVKAKTLSLVWKREDQNEKELLRLVIDKDGLVDIPRALAGRRDLGFRVAGFARFDCDPRPDVRQERILLKRH